MKALDLVSLSAKRWTGTYSDMHHLLTESLIRQLKHESTSCQLVIKPTALPAKHSGLCG